MRTGRMVAIALWAVTVPALATPGPATADDGLFDQRRLADAELAELRGGFQTSAGVVSFAVDLTGMVMGQDGSPLSSYSFQAVLSDGTLTTGPLVLTDSDQVSAAIHQTASSLVLTLQAGDGNAFEGVAGAGLFSVIQNNLDNVIISQNTGIEMTLDLDLSRIQANNIADALVEAGLLGL